MYKARRNHAGALSPNGPKGLLVYGREPFQLNSLIIELSSLPQATVRRGQYST